jgi:hypothetical protein
MLDSLPCLYECQDTFFGRELIRKQDPNRRTPPDTRMQSNEVVLSSAGHSDFREGPGSRRRRGVVLSPRSLTVRSRAMPRP